MSFTKGQILYDTDVLTDSITAIEVISSDEHATYVKLANDPNRFPHTWRLNDNAQLFTNEKEAKKFLLDKNGGGLI